MKRIIVSLVCVMLVSVALMGAAVAKKSPAELLVEKVQADQEKAITAADVKYHKAVDPIIAKYQKIKDLEITKAKKQAKLRLEVALKQAKARKDELAVAVLENAMLVIKGDTIDTNDPKQVILGKWIEIKSKASYEFKEDGKVPNSDGIAANWELKENHIKVYWKKPMYDRKWHFPIKANGTRVTLVNGKVLIFKKVK